MQGRDDRRVGYRRVGTTRSGRRKASITSRSATMEPPSLVMPEAKRSLISGDVYSSYPEIGPIMTKPGLPIEERFWLHVDRSDPAGCWEWTASRRRRGYGQFRAKPGEPMWQAHRMAWTLTFGPIPGGLLVCHHCDNPPCCRPDHLFLGTNEHNVQDMVRKGRLAGFTSRPPREISARVRTLTDDQVRDIRRRFAAGESGRSIAR